jgi:hypothetical protein
MSGKRHSARGSVTAVALALAAIVLVVSSTSSAATTAANFTGHWSLVDHITAGPETGQDFPWQGDWTQNGSQLTGTGGYTIVGTVSGSTVSFTTTSGGAYVATFHLTMSADGKSLKGTAKDNEGRSATVTATGAGVPAKKDAPHIKGRVTDSFREGVDNVRVVAQGKGGSKQSITSHGGYYDITLAMLKKPASYRVSASNKLYKHIDPKVRTVTARPNADAFAAFTVPTGKLRGTIRELDCAPASALLAVAPDCRGRKISTAAVVEIHGDQVDKKYIKVKADGTYKFKVPVGKYDVRVNSLTLARGTHADVCKEDRRIPVATDAVDPDPVACDDIVDVEAKKGAVKTTDFVAVPRVIVPRLRLLVFDRQNKPHDTVSVQAGLRDPVDPELFGSYGLRSGKDQYPVVQCRTGCATIEAIARDLLGRPVKGARFTGITATPIKPSISVTPDNENGVACFTARNVPDLKSRDCLHEEFTDADGRALGIYAAPGIVPEIPAINHPDLVTTYIRATAKAHKYADAPIAAGPLVIVPNELAGSSHSATLVLNNQRDVNELNLITDPNTTKQGLVHVVRTIPEACGTVSSYFLGKKFPIVSQLCDALEVPATLSKSVLEKYVDMVGSGFLTSRLGLRSEGFLASFTKARFPDKLEDAPTSATELLNIVIPDSVTPAARFLSDYLKDWRKLHGGDHFDSNGDLVRSPIGLGEQVVLRVFEVSHYALSGGDLVRVPGVYLSVQASFQPEPQTLLVTGEEGYDPLRWLG